MATLTRFPRTRLVPRAAAPLVLAASLLVPSGGADGQLMNPVLSAASALYAIPSGGSYDAANLYVAPDGAVWTASAVENVILKLSPDGTSATRWTMTTSPSAAGPSSLLPNPDGTFWVTELSGSNIALFDPATGNLTEWLAFARRPTVPLRRPDGKLWLPETGGALTLFDPADGSLIYYQSTAIYSCSYPFLDTDGSIWVSDFIGSYLMHIAPDGQSGKRWALPTTVNQPSKIIRGFDGALWISAYLSGQLLRLDPSTMEMKVFDLPLGTLPYDLMNYKDRIVFTDEAFGIVGFFDPAGSVPSETDILTPDANDLVLAPTAKTSVPVTTLLTSATDTIAAPPPAISTGGLTAGLAEYMIGIGSNWALALDQARGRILYGTKGYIGALMPAIPASQDDLYFPSAASIAGRTARWKTQLVAWNRATPDSTSVRNPLTVAEQLLPNGWIAGYLPNSSQTIGAGQLLAQDDPIGNEMGGPDSFGALRLEVQTPGNTADLFAWARVYTTRPDGGTYGLSMNPVKPGAAVGAGDTGFLFTPPDAAHRTNAGFVVVNAASGTLSVIDASGTALASRPFSWPGGTHVQYSPLFESFGLSPVPSARLAVQVDSGSVLPFGTSLDPVTSDPVGLELFKVSNATTGQWLPAVSRGGPPLGPSATTDIQLFNPGTGPASVKLVFRSGAPPQALPSTTVTVPPGQVVTLIDPLGARLGLSGVTGALDVISDQPVAVFARVHAADPSGGTYGYGLAAHNSGDAVPGGSRGVFLADTDSGWDVVQSDLLLANIADTTTTVTLNLTKADGTAAGTRDFALGPKEVRYVTMPWFSIAGAGTTAGRLDVVPASTAVNVFATLLRKDQKTGDVDAILPVVIPR